MGRHRGESIAGVFISRAVGIVAFLILLGVLNILADVSIRMPVYLQVVGFLNANLGLLILIAALFLIGDLFGALVFPLNLPGPIVSAFGAVYLVIFLVRLFLLVSAITGVGLFSVAGRALTLPVYLFVFIIALVAGYIGLFTGRA